MCEGERETQQTTVDLAEIFSLTAVLWAGRKEKKESQVLTTVLLFCVKSAVCGRIRLLINCIFLYLWVGWCGLPVVMSWVGAALKKNTLTRIITPLFSLTY